MSQWLCWVFLSGVGYVPTALTEDSGGQRLGAEKKEREREGYASEGDFLGTLKDKWMKSRRKRGST